MLDVTAKDILARFILERRGKYTLSTGEVKFRAFMPNPRGELSVFVITNWSEDRVWQVGQEYVAGPQEKTLMARGDVVVSVVLENDLKVDRDDNPPGHANVLNWPEKSKQKLVAIKLAKAAKLVINPPELQN